MGGRAHRFSMPNPMPYSCIALSFILPNSCRVNGRPCFTASMATSSTCFQLGLGFGLGLGLGDELATCLGSFRGDTRVGDGEVFGERLSS